VSTNLSDGVVYFETNNTVIAELLQAIFGGNICFSLTFVIMSMWCSMPGCVNYMHDNKLSFIVLPTRDLPRYRQRIAALKDDACGDQRLSEGFSG
jgi:hypothetical protein